MENVSHAASADEALRLATISPGRAQALALVAERAARSEGDWAAVSKALRAQGVAAFQLRLLDRSRELLTAAVSAGTRAGSAQLVGEARMSLAATLMISGAPRKAVVAIDLALKDLTGLAAARAHVQRSAILQAIGNDDEVLAELRYALPLLRRSGDAEWEARALSNRSLLYTSRRAFAAAESDLVTTRELCQRHGLELAGAYAAQNLGCLKADQGDVVAALDLFRAAETTYRRLGMQVGSLLIDRGELLLSVRLVDEARAAAEAAVDVLEVQKRRVHAPDAQLLLSTVALVQNDTATALAAAERAARGFRRLHRDGGVALARYARLQALTASSPESVHPSQARRCASDLAAAGWLMPSLEARVLAGYMELQRGRLPDARVDLKLASRARFTGPADVRARAWLAEAILRKADGRRRSASVAVSCGLRILERYQNSLGATELRAHVSVHRGSLARLGLRIALEDRAPRRVFRWAERGRATALLMRAPKPPSDPVLASALSDLRVTMTELEQRLRTGRLTTDLVQRQVRLEREIAERTRTLPAAMGGRPPSPATIEELSASLAGAALVEYVQLDRTLHAVSLVAGKMRLHTVGSMDAVTGDLEHVSFALRRLSNPQLTGGRVAGPTAVLDGIGKRFDELLMRPLWKHLGDRPVVVVPTGALQSMPWSVLPSCLGRPVTVSPSASLWHAASRRPPLKPSAELVVVAGPGLDGAVEEATAISALDPRWVQLLNEDATVSAVCAAMDGAAVVHIATHGRLRSDNPFFSSLSMADGPVTVYDLEHLDTAPRHVVLAACDTARPHVIAGEEVIGLAAALLAQGTVSLIAPLLPVPDNETVPLMNTYHRHLSTGMNPAEALALAQGKAASAEGVERATATTFVCMGDGFSDAFQPPAALREPEPADISGR